MELIGQYVYKYIYGEGMVANIISFDKIIDVDDNITLANAKIILKNNRWYLSGEVGTNIYKIKINYSKKGTHAKKHKDKLYSEAIDNLNLKIYNKVTKTGLLPYSYPNCESNDGFTLEGHC